jgi:hypothetical protein
VVVWRLAGRWAGLTAGTIVVATSPFVNYSRVAVDFHQPACLAAVLIAAFAVWLSRDPPLKLLLPVWVLATLIAGTALASDTLFLVTGFAPAAAAGLLWAALRRWRAAAALLTSVAVAFGVSKLTTALMTGAGVIIAPPANLQLAPLDQLWPQAKRALGLIAQVANGSFTRTWEPPAASFTYALALACSILAIAGLCAPTLAFVRFRHQLRRRPAETVWVGFWVAASLLTFIAYVVTDIGVNLGFYLIIVLYAGAATGPLLLARMRAGPMIGGVLVSVLVTASLIAVAGTANEVGGLPALAALAPRIAAIARAEHASTGYTSEYFDAAALAWSTQLAFQMDTVDFCAPGLLCPFGFNSVSTWYAPTPGRSFVLQDSGADTIDTSPGSQLGAPIATFKLSSEYTLDIYAYNLAGRLWDSGGHWAPTLSLGTGFNASEQFQGQTSNWMIQHGQILIQNPVASTVTLVAAGFANATPRLLELETSSGTVLAHQLVPPSLSTIRLGPFALPRGNLTLELVSIPGPKMLSKSDTREASVFLEPLLLEGGPTPDPSRN